MGIQKTNKHSHDYERGIRAYTAEVGNCVICQKLCNTLWQSSEYPIIKPSFTCCEECANREAEWRVNQ